MAIFQYLCNRRSDCGVTKLTHAKTFPFKIPAEVADADA